MGKMTSPGTTMTLDVTEMTVEQIQAGFASGAFTCEQLTQTFLDRIAAYNPKYNAVIFLNTDALEVARDIDQRRSTGEQLGPLAGVPIVVKDTMDMKGAPSTAGWSILSRKAGGVDLVPSMDSPVVARMRAAGAVILGKTNVPILSATGSHANNSWAGPTFNAAAHGLLPGGSSAGTATAVASSMAVLGLAEETGGSIQNPAAAQALVSIKPTFALVPNVGVMPLSSLRDTVGPIARCVRDAALVLDALAGFTMEDPKTVAAIGHLPKGGYTSRLDPDALRGKRIGLYGHGWRNQPLSEETERLYQRAQDELRTQGAILIDDPFQGSGFAALRTPTPTAYGGEYDARGLESVPYDIGRYLERLGPDAALKTFADFAVATAREDPFSPTGVLNYMQQLPAFLACLSDPDKAPDMSEFIGIREAHLEIINTVFQKHRLDALIMPQMRDELGLRDGPELIHETTVSEINIAGTPGITVPAGYYLSGAPFSLILVGPLWSEVDLLALAYAYEQATKHRNPPTLIRN